MKTTTQKEVIENMKLLGFKKVSRREYNKSEDKLDAIELNCFKHKYGSWTLFLEQFYNQ